MKALWLASAPELEGLPRRQATRSGRVYITATPMYYLCSPLSPVLVVCIVSLTSRGHGTVP